jgi:NAD(P)-dependent dehydrogenase (short-subunit alcohol dehydrogenase family)
MSSIFDLRGKGAIITGSSRGIGRGIAKALAAHGANVIVSSRKIDACRIVADEINSIEGGGRAHAIAASIGNRSALEGLVAAARQALGSIDILVCNAATNPFFGPMRDISDEQFEKIFRNNVLSTHWLVQLVAPEMMERRTGSIIITSSIGGYRGSASIGAYNISKAGDFQLARNLAIELGPYNIRVNCLAPGLIRTDFSRALWEDPENLERALASTPLGRIGEVEDVAGAAVFLASSAAEYVTGQTIVVDGGNTIAPLGT